MDELLKIVLPYFFCCLAAYLAGAVNFAWIVARKRGIDIQHKGSGNPGTTNVGRVMGLSAAAVVFVGDVLKAAAMVFAARFLFSDSSGIGEAATLSCVLGHMYPFYLDFKGGKGVATTVGVMLYCFPIPALFCVAGTVALIAVFRYISLGSLFMVVSFAVASVFFSNGNLWIILWACALMIMCVIRHHANIGRLLNGTENKLGKHSK